MASNVSAQKVAAQLVAVSAEKDELKDVLKTTTCPELRLLREKQLAGLQQQLAALQEQETLLLKQSAEEFRDMDAVTPERNFYVQPRQLQQLLPLVVGSSEAYFVVCDGRQTGKSTLAHAMKRALQQEGHPVHLIALGDAMPTCQQVTPDAFYAYLGGLLTKCSPQRFAAGAIIDSNTFIAALQHRPQKLEYFLIDEAATLATLPTNILDAWLDTIRELKNRMCDHNVGGIMLFGTWAVTQLLEERNRCDGKCRITNIGMTKPKFARAYVAQPAARQPLKVDSVGRALPNPDLSKPPSRTSPFKANGLLSVQRFTQDDITDLLQQYVQQQQRLPSGSHTLSEGDARAIAASIHSLTNGVKGLTGVCCRAVSMHQMSSREQWDKFSSRHLVAYVTRHAVFKKVSQALGTVFSVRRQDGTLTMEAEGQPGGASQSNQAPQQQAPPGIAYSSSSSNNNNVAHEVMAEVVMRGHCEVQAGALPYLDKLMQEGLLVPLSSDGCTPHWGFPDSEWVPVRLALPAPLVGACILYRLRMQAISTTDPPAGGVVDMHWLLTQVVRNLNINTVMAKEAQNANGNPSEYAFQSQFYLLLSDLLRTYHPAFQLVAEARKLDDPGYSRRRLDLLAFGVGLPTYAWELLSSGGRAQVEEHVMRAACHREMHSAQLVHVVNLTTQGDVQQLHHPRVMPDGVQLVHVLLPANATVANVVFATEHMQTTLAQPQGQLLIYRPSDPM